MAPESPMDRSAALVSPPATVDRACRMPDRQGVALAAAIMVLALVGLISAVLLSGMITSLRTSLSDLQQARTFYAAEAAAELALAQIEELLRDGALSDADLASITPPTLEPFSFDGFEVSGLNTVRVETITDGPFAGLYALTRDVRVYAPAADPAGAISAVILEARAQAIPLFQFGVFYDVDLEATNGPPMEFLGRVHSNGNIYLSSANAWYREPITTPKKVFHRRKNSNASRNGVYIDDAEGNEVRLDFDSDDFPAAEAFKAESCAKFDCRLQSDAFGVPELRLPLPEGVPAYELLGPRRDSDGDGARAVKFSWGADTRVAVDLTDVKSSAVHCAGGGPPEWVPAITVTRDGQPTPDPATTCRIFDWEWSGFYDGREAKLKDVLNIDLAALDAWVAGDPVRTMEVIYIEFVVPTGIDDEPNPDVRNRVLDATIDPAVRMINGRTLPNRLTVATEWPVYTLGDYNSVAKRPAALAGDGITILSNAWSDGANRPDDDTCDSVSEGNPCTAFTRWAENWQMKRSAETTVNAAILAGHWATPCDWVEPGCPDGYQDWYGGGIENFPRFLERWRTASGGRVIFHYRGALISPFTSQKTPGTWNGSYYSPPQRDWSFDTDFRNAELLPPATPHVGMVLRAAFREAL